MRHEKTQKKVIGIVRNTRGEGYIDTVVGIVASMMIIVIALIPKLHP